MKFVRNRMMVTGVLGMLVCILTFGGYEQRMVCAWWGMLYPEYCYMKQAEIQKDEPEMETGKRKISFWLAKAFDWW